MIRDIYQIAAIYLPDCLKNWLRRLGWIRRADALIWELPSPLSGYRMKGPGVFGTYIKKPYESPVVQALICLTKPGWIAVDVGAHLGFFTLLLAHLVGENGHVFAFEAHPENARWLQENVALNGLAQRITVENLAVSDGSQTSAHLNAPPHYTCEWSIVRKSPVDHSLEVPAVSLDRYFAQGPRLDFVKLDIEGAEYLALQGMCAVLKRDRPIFLIELHGEEGEAAAQFLQQSDYVLMDLHSCPITGPVFPSHILAKPRNRG